MCIVFVCVCVQIGEICSDFASMYACMHIGMCIFVGISKKLIKIFSFEI